MQTPKSAKWDKKKTTRLEKVFFWFENETDSALDHQEGTWNIFNGCRDTGFFPNEYKVGDSYAQRNVSSQKGLLNYSERQRNFRNILEMGHKLNFTLFAIPVVTH